MACRECGRGCGRRRLRGHCLGHPWKVVPWIATNTAAASRGRRRGSPWASINRGKPRDAADNDGCVRGYPEKKHNVQASKY